MSQMPNQPLFNGPPNFKSPRRFAALIADYSITLVMSLFYLVIAAAAITAAAVCLLALWFGATLVMKAMGV